MCLSYRPLSKGAASPPYIGADGTVQRTNKMLPKSRTRPKWKRPSLLHKFEKNKAKKQHRRTVPFSVAITSVHNLDPKADDTLVDALVGEPSDSVGVDDDDALMDADCDTEDSDTEPARFAHDH